MSQKKRSYTAVVTERDRSVVLGEYIKETGATVRETAKKFGISKSTVHKDVTERLMYENRNLYEEVREVLLKNKAERHLRGGNATKEKYKEKRLSQNL